jgi:DNA-binding response OmpR family regulator
MPFKLLVADDNINDKGDEISRLPEMLRAVGYEAVATPDGEAVYDLVLECKPDLVVLDIQFGKQRDLGFNICDAIRSNDPEIPIILITAVNDSIEHILRGFEAGANDYVVRPRDNREIISRIRANLPPEVIIVDNYLCVDFVGFQVYVRQGGSWQEIQLKRLEFELLKVLTMNYQQKILTTTLKSKIWEDIKSDDVLAVYIHRLREKIEPDPENPKYIETIKGFGYRFTGKPVHMSQRFLEKPSDWKKEGRCPTCGSMIT